MKIAYRLSNDYRGVGDTVMLSIGLRSPTREEDGSPHVEKNYIGTPPLISERADIILILKSRTVSSEKRRPLSQPAAQKEKWPSDLIYERTNERIARPWAPLLMLALAVSSSPILSSPLVCPPSARFVFARRICDGGDCVLELGTVSREKSRRASSGY